MRMRTQVALHRCGRSITRSGPARRAAVLTTLGVMSAASTLTIVSGASTEAGEAAPSAVRRSQARVRLPDLPVEIRSGAFSASALTSARGSVGVGRAVASPSYDGIPSRALTAYQRAAAIMDSVDKACGLTWPVLAAVGTIESDNGRHAGSLLDDAGVATPSILGPPLNGRSRVALIRDTDAGRYDHDTRYDRAVGPMQFIPTTWSAVGVDADGDGQRNPQDIDDAALAGGVFLCGGSEDLGSSRGLRQALFRYNHSWDYVRAVIGIIDRYAAGLYTDVPNDLVPGQFLALAPQPAASGHASQSPSSQSSIVATNAGHGGTGHPLAGPGTPAAEEDPGGSPATDSGPPTDPASPAQPPTGSLPESVEDVTEELAEECLEDTSVLNLGGGTTSCVAAVIGALTPRRSGQ